MKLYYLLTFLLLSLTISAQTSQVRSFMSGGVNRSYRIYVPSIYNGQTAVPIVFNFHGYGSNASQQEGYGDFRAIADTANFILIHPEGTDLGGGYKGWNSFGSVASATPDINFVSSLIDTIAANYNVDLDRVYSTGMSNGGFFSHDLACLLNSRFTAIASVTGSMVESHRTTCNPAGPIPVMQIHGTTDPVVPYNGQGGAIPFSHVDSVVATWVSLNACNTTPTMSNVPNTSTSDGSTVEHYRYTNGNMGAVVEFFKVINGGHTWPGSALLVPSNGNTNQDIKASVEIWRFFSKYRKSDFVVSAQQNIAASGQSFNFYPNPSKGLFVVEMKGAEQANLQVFNTMGQLVLEKELNNPQTTIDLSYLPAAVYYYRLQRDNQLLQSSKLIFQN